MYVKLDPGIAVVNETSGAVVFAAELSHRGHKITEALDTRRAVRRSRRERHTRYRKPRFLNRENRGRGWLPPSLESRISNVLTWVERLSRLCPLTATSMEVVKFDMQAMENPEISGMEYQQGELQGYEIREYLLQKWGRQCAYCGAKDVPELLQKILAQAKVPLKDAAAVNVTFPASARRKPRRFSGSGQAIVASALAQGFSKYAKVPKEGKRRARALGDRPGLLLPGL